MGLWNFTNNELAAIARWMLQQEQITSRDFFDCDWGRFLTDNDRREIWLQATMLLSYSEADRIISNMPVTKKMHALRSIRKNAQRLDKL